MLRTTGFHIASSTPGLSIIEALDVGCQVPCFTNQQMPRTEA